MVLPASTKRQFYPLRPFFVFFGFFAATCSMLPPARFFTSTHCWSEVPAGPYSRLRSLNQPVAADERNMNFTPATYWSPSGSVRFVTFALVSLPTSQPLPTCARCGSPRYQ